MTTEQLIDSCTHQGVHVSTTQLGRWVRAGLIPASLRKRHGRGRGLGAEWHWEAECLPRVVLIARTLTTGDPSLRRAADTLAVAGYTPDAERLRQVLLDRSATYERLLTKRQPYLTDSRPVTEKQRRLTRYIRRKIPDMPDSALQPFTAFIGTLLGVIPLDDPNASDVMKQLQQFISIPSVQQRLQTIDDSVLLEKYEEAGRMIPLLVPVILMSINLLLLPLLRQQLQKAKNDTSTLPTGIDSEAILEQMQMEAGGTLITSNRIIGELRLCFAILLIAIPTKNAALLAEWNVTLLDIVSRVFNHFGFSFGPIVSLLESAKTSSEQPQPGIME